LCGDSDGRAGTAMAGTLHDEVVLPRRVAATALGERCRTARYRADRFVGTGIPEPLPDSRRTRADEPHACSHRATAAGLFDRVRLALPGSLGRGARVPNSRPVQDQARHAEVHLAARDATAARPADLARTEGVDAHAAGHAILAGPRRARAPLSQCRSRTPPRFLRSRTNRFADSNVLARTPSGNHDAPMDRDPDRDLGGDLSGWTRPTSAARRRARRAACHVDSVDDDRSDAVTAASPPAGAVTPTRSDLRSRPSTSRRGFPRSSWPERTPSPRSRRSTSPRRPPARSRAAN